MLVRGTLPNGNPWNVTNCIGMKPEQNITFTRTELFKALWEEPMSKLAPRLGISDVGLAKICRKFDIPTPPRGYWVKLQYGKDVAKPALPPTPSQIGDQLVVQQEARTSGSDESLPDDIASSLAAVRQRDITVPNQSAKVHSIIQSWQAEDESKKRDLYANKAWVNSTERRRRRILSTLFREIEHLRGSVEALDRCKFILSIAGERIEVACSERLRQVKVPLTPDERRGPWNASQEYRTDHQASGEIRVRISDYYDEPIRRAWHDRTHRPLENQLQDILIGLYRVAAVERRKRFARETAERTRQDIERRGWVLEAQRAKVDKYLKGITTQADSWARAACIRNYANAVIKSLGNSRDDGSLTERASARWALAAADAIDPLVTGTDVRDLFEQLPESEKKDRAW
jgi:hypothetical protein